MMPSLKQLWRAILVMSALNVQSLNPLLGIDRLYLLISLISIDEVSVCMRVAHIHAFLWHVCACVRVCVCACVNTGIGDNGIP